MLSHLSCDNAVMRKSRIDTAAATGFEAPLLLAFGPLPTMPSTAMEADLALGRAMMATFLDDVTVGRPVTTVIFIQEQLRAAATAVDFQVLHPAQNLVTV